MGLGALLIFFGVALSSRLVRPLARVLGWPAARVGGAAGRLARDNARRNPQRTGSTAAALMIGLALVTLVATLAAGIVQTFRGAVDELWKESQSDYGITAQNNFSPIPTAAWDAAAQAPGEVGDERADGQRPALRRGDVRDRRRSHARPENIQLTWKDGSQDVLADLGEDGAFVDDGFAEDHELEVGSRITMLFPSGERASFTVDGIFDPPTGGSPFGSVTISTAAWDENVEQPRNLYSFVAMRGDVSDANTAALEQALADFPERKGADARGVHRQPDRPPELDPEHPLRPARPVRAREPPSGSSTRSC